MTLFLCSFKQNYTVGDPNANLYIKNLAKDVVVDDFYHIFGEFNLFFGNEEIYALSFYFSAKDSY